MKLIRSLVLVALTTMAQVAPALSTYPADVATGRDSARNLSALEFYKLKVDIISARFVLNELRLKRAVLQTLGIPQTTNTATITIGVGTAIAEVLIGARLFSLNFKHADRILIARTDALYANIEGIERTIRTQERRARKLGKYVAGSPARGEELLRVRAEIRTNRELIRQNSNLIVRERARAPRLLRTVGELTITTGVLAGALLIFDAAHTAVMTFTLDHVDEMEAKFERILRDARAALGDQA